MKITFKLNVLLMITCGLFSTSGFAITKCQDAQGKWHYGDYAIAECNNSELTELNDRGFVVDKTAAPKTEEQLQQELEELKREEQQKKHQVSEVIERERILNIYETEADIDRISENQMNSVQGNIEVHKAYLKSVKARIKKYEVQKAKMQSPTGKKSMEDKIAKAKKNILLYTHELQLLEENKTEIEEKFKKEKALYQMLRQEPDNRKVH